MVFDNVPNVINKLQEQTGTSLHALAARAEISYATAHAWKSGRSSPSVEKFQQFLKANGFKLRVVNDA